MIDPGRDLGHVDRKKKPAAESIIPVAVGKQGNPACTQKEDDGRVCEDCG